MELASPIEQQQVYVQKFELLQHGFLLSQFKQSADMQKQLSQQQQQQQLQAAEATQKCWTRRSWVFEAKLQPSFAAQEAQVEEKTVPGAVLVSKDDGDDERATALTFQPDQVERQFRAEAAQAAAMSASAASATPVYTAGEFRVWEAQQAAASRSRTVPAPLAFLYIVHGWPLLHVESNGDHFTVSVTRMGLFRSFTHNKHGWPSKVRSCTSGAAVTVQSRS